MKTLRLSHMMRTTMREAVGRIPYVSLLLTLLAVFIHFTNGLRVNLIFERSALAHLELWRLLTCHWVHLNWDHLFWSAATFLSLGSICEFIDKKKTYVTLAISVSLVPAGIWYVQADLAIYGGLSGLDCALYALLFALLINREVKSSNWAWTSFYVMGLVALLGKVTYETVTGQTIFVSNSHQGMVPVPLSHLLGGFVGLLVGLSDGNEQVSQKKIKVHPAKTVFFKLFRAQTPILVGWTKDPGGLKAKGRGIDKTKTKIKCHSHVPAG